MDYQEVETKKEFRDLIEEMIKETANLILRFPQIEMYQSIYDQLQDIKYTIIVNKKELTEDEVDERYTIGAIVTNNFDSEKELYARKLEDIFGAACEYFELP